MANNFSKPRSVNCKKIAKTAKTGMIWISDDDVVENFDFEKLTGSNEVTGDFYVRFRWS
jgi:hypothetical protein